MVCSVCESGLTDAVTNRWLWETNSVTTETAEFFGVQTTKSGRAVKMTFFQRYALMHVHLNGVQLIVVASVRLRSHTQSASVAGFLTQSPRLIGAALPNCASCTGVAV